jgi:hypothetical protein
VPRSDILEGRTVPTLQEPFAWCPMIVVHSGTEQPRESYAQVRMDRRWYWVAVDDYESKVTFTIVELLKSVAESTRGVAQPVLTIPTG